MGASQEAGSGKTPQRKTKSQQPEVLGWAFFKTHLGRKQSLGTLKIYKMLNHIDQLDVARILFVLKTRFCYITQVGLELIWPSCFSLRRAGIIGLTHPAWLNLLEYSQWNGVGHALLFIGIDSTEWVLKSESAR